MIVTTDITTKRHIASAVALGIFDGVHLGHRSVISTMVQRANMQNLQPIVFTFEVGRQLPSSKKNATLLHTQQMKHNIMQKLGVKELLAPQFADLKGRSPEKFVEMLCSTLNAKVLVCGENYHFGKGAVGNVDLLRTLAGKYGVEVVVAPPVTMFGATVSSTKIREAILSGDIERATKMLGTQFMVEGKVVYGNQIGRTISFPTVNMALETWRIVPRFGVYFSRVLINDVPYWGVTNIGVKPTVGANYPVMETHILGFEGDLYGETLCVELWEFIRPERKFESIAELSEQIAKDVGKARALSMNFEK